MVKGDVTFAKDDFLIFKTPDISTTVANCSKIVNAKIFLHKILPCGKADTCDKRNFCFYPDVDGQINATSSSSNPLPSFMEAEIMDQSRENDKRYGNELKIQRGDN